MGNFIKKYESFIFLVIGMIIVLLVNPKGNFPLNDDWRYAFMVQSMLQEGNFALNSEIAPTILFQAVWGYLFLTFTDFFSFTNLRISTLVLSVTALWCLHLLLRKQWLGQPTWRGVALLAFNPIFFVLSFSFMSDVPFLAICLGSMYFYLQFLKTSQFKYRILATLLALLACWVRQPGLFLILAFELNYLWQNRKDSKKWRSSLFIITLALGQYFLIETVVKAALDLRENYIKVESEYFVTILKDPGEFIFDLGTRTLMTIFYLGLFVLPLIYPIIKTFFRQIKNPKSLFLLLLGFNLMIATIGWWWLGRIFPFGGNIFYNWGLGPQLLFDTKDLSLAPPNQMPKIIMYLIGICCQVNGSCLLILLGNYLLKKWKEPVNLFLGLLLLLYFGAMSVFSFFDRHLLLIFIIILIWLYQMKIMSINRRPYLFLALMLIFVFFSIAGTRDYLQWNRIVHENRQVLLKKGVPSRDIDAGLANNGFYEVRVEGAQYHFSFQEVEGMEVVEKYEYFSWVVLKNKELYLLSGKLVQ